MAGHAALEILSRRLAVAQDEPLLRIMETRIEPPFRGEPRAHVTVGAELARIMAIGAARLARVCCRRMPREEAGRMVARRRIGGIGAVAVQALRTDMAAAACGGTRVGDGTVQVGKIPTV